MGGGLVSAIRRILVNRCFEKTEDSIAALAGAEILSKEEQILLWELLKACCIIHHLYLIRTGYELSETMSRCLMLYDTADVNLEALGAERPPEEPEKKKLH